MRGKGGSQHLIDLDCGFFGSAPILASCQSVLVWLGHQKEEKRINSRSFILAALQKRAFHEVMNLQGCKVFLFCSYVKITFIQCILTFLSGNLRAEAFGKVDNAMAWKDITLTVMIL